MRCEDVRDHVVDLTAKDLMSSDPVVRAHLETCERCRGEAHGAVTAWSLLPAIPDEEADSAAMRQQFAGALRAFRQTARTGAFPLPWRSWRGQLAWRPAHVAAALFIALLSGALIDRQVAGTARGGDEGLQAVRQELREVREMLTLSLLQQTMASERIKGVSTAGRLDDPGAAIVTALADVLLHDPNVNVRLACVRALARFKDQPDIRERVEDAVTREPSPLVAIALISYIVEAHDARAVDTLRRLAEDPARDEAVRDTARRGIERLSDGGRI